MALDLFEVRNKEELVERHPEFFESWKGTRYSIKIPAGVTQIEENAFLGCRGLTSVIIPDTVTKIEERAFAICINLTSVTIPKRVTHIGSAAFSECRELLSVIIPDSVIEVGKGAFALCGLKSLYISKMITVITENCFAFCDDLTSVIIPNQVTTLEQNAFSNCLQLSSITVPDSVRVIQKECFKDCENLLRVDVGPETVIAPTAFMNCSNLKAIFIRGKNIPKAKIFGTMINEDVRKPLLILGTTSSPSIELHLSEPDDAGESSFRDNLDVVAEFMGELGYMFNPDYDFDDYNDWDDFINDPDYDVNQEVLPIVDPDPGPDPDRKYWVMETTKRLRKFTDALSTAITDRKIFKPTSFRHYSAEQQRHLRTIFLCYYYSRIRARQMLEHTDKMDAAEKMSLETKINETQPLSMIPFELLLVILEQDDSIQIPREKFPAITLPSTIRLTSYVQ